MWKPKLDIQKIKASVSGTAAKAKSWVVDTPARKKQLSSVKKQLGVAGYKLINVFFDNYHKVWLVKKFYSFLGYLLFFTASLAMAWQFDSSDNLKQFLHSPDANEIIIGIATILLALLVPVAIVLVDDAKSSILERQTIVRSIIRLPLLPFFLIAVCLFLLTPPGMVLIGDTLTLRTLWGTGVMTGVLFILLSYYRAYRWLSDGSINPSGSATPLPAGSPNESFTSYKFAQIVRHLSGSKGYEAWAVVWRQQFPSEYEHVLHTAFFKRATDTIGSGKSKRYAHYMLEVQAYERYFNMRNKDEWHFYGDYMQQFLKLHVTTEALVRADRKRARTEGLFGAKMALERIIKKFFSLYLTPDGAWSLFEAMDTYIRDKGLLELGNSTTPRDNVVLNGFIDQLFDNLYQEKLDTLDVSSELETRCHWTVSYENLYVNRYNVSHVLEKRFNEWLFKKFDKLSTLKNIYRLDTLIDVLFPEADKFVIGELYWLIYKGQHSIQSRYVIEEYLKNKKSFVLGSRVVVSYWMDEEEERLQDFREEMQRQVDIAVKLFATKYRVYFQEVWNLQSLIDTTQTMVQEENRSDQERRTLNTLIANLTLLKAYYDSPTTN